MVESRWILCGHRSHEAKMIDRSIGHLVHIAPDIQPASTSANLSLPAEEPSF